MPADFAVPVASEYFRVLPEIILAGVGVLIMLLEPLTGRRRKHRLGYIAVAGFAAALVPAVLGEWTPGPAFSGMVAIDGFAVFFRVLVILAGLLVALASSSYLRREEAESGEYYALLMWSVAGQCVMVAANELIVIFIGLEISSIASYVLAGFLRRERLANEAAAKYFLLGSFATAFLLYGIALIYGGAGSTNLLAIRHAISTPGGAPGLLVAASAALIFVGLAFKISAAPFQMWAPDVYQGAPTPVTAFLSAGPKAAAFAILLRVYMTAFLPVSAWWEPIVWVSALLSMVVGNFAALLQTNVKRLLAYSSIAHAGYVLVAVAAHSPVGTAAAMFYLAAYAFMNLGAFLLVAWFSRRGERYVNIDDFAGLAWRQPVAASLFTLFLLSLIGVPLTGGFFAKFYVFKAALDANLIWLTVLGLLNTAVAAYYYLRILVVMWMQEPAEATADLPPVPLGTKLALWVSALAILLLGIFPTAVLSYAIHAAALTR
ncbi:MAG: NADH-quinone oxidoreductase subunit N [Bryobacteraceae bacterium]